MWQAVRVVGLPDAADVGVGVAGTMMPLTIQAALRWLRQDRHHLTRWATFARVLRSDRVHHAQHRPEAKSRAGYVAAPAVARTTALAARLLPAAEQAHYAEEFSSELWDLASTGAGRRTQLVYAFRQLVCAMWLQAAVRASRRGKASQ